MSCFCRSCQHYLNRLWKFTSSTTRENSEIELHPRSILHQMLCTSSEKGCRNLLNYGDGALKTQISLKTSKASAHPS